MTESGATPRAKQVPLARAGDGRLIAGVCAGLAAHLGLPTIWLRIGMLVFTMFGGAGALFYLWIWVTVPSSDVTAPDDLGNGVQRMRQALTRGSAPVRPAPVASTSASAPTAAASSVSSNATTTSFVATSFVTADTAAAAATTSAAETSVVGEPGTGKSCTGRSDTAASAAATPRTLAQGAFDSSPQTVLGDATSRTAVPDSELPAQLSTPVAPLSASGAHTKSTALPSFTRWPVAELLLGGSLLIAGLGLLLTRLGVGLDLAILLPAMVVLVGVGLTWWQIADRNRPERNLLPRVLGALALVAVGMLTFFVTASQPSVFTVVAAALAVLAGVALALAPWLLRINRELINERSARAREAERSDIAAHLHDSVLQTLAAIQQRSEPGSDVARLARGQERELREWLFRGADGVAGSSREAADVELRAHAAALEAEYPVRFEVVSVGSSAVGSSAVGSSATGSSPGAGGGSAVPDPMVAAAREAMLNAAKHAGGEVSIYIEVSPGKASIDVMDRGPGLGAAFDSQRRGVAGASQPHAFDSNELPDGRMGVRESIIGRMERAGGTASLVPGPAGRGTSVRLAMPLPEAEEDAE